MRPDTLDVLKELGYLFSAFLLPLMLTGLGWLALQSLTITRKVYDAIYDPKEGVKEVLRQLLKDHGQLNGTVMQHSMRLDQLERDVKALRDSFDHLKEGTE